MPLLAIALWFAFVYTLFLPTILVMISWKKPRRGVKGECGACGYSLANLPTDAVCPECGASSDSHENRYLDWSRRFSERKRRLGRILLAMLFAIPAIYLVLHAGVAAAYWWDGFGFERGWDLAPGRELAKADTLLVLMCTMPFVPLLAFARRYSLRSAIVALVFISLACCIEAAYFAYPN